jgi:hypothetical protein
VINNEVSAMEVLDVSINVLDASWDTQRDRVFHVIGRRYSGLASADCLHRDHLMEDAWMTIVGNLPRLGWSFSEVDHAVSLVSLACAHWGYRWSVFEFIFGTLERKWGLQRYREFLSKVQDAALLHDSGLLLQFLQVS